MTSVVRTYPPHTFADPHDPTIECSVTYRRLSMGEMAALPSLSEEKPLREVLPDYLPHIVVQYTHNGHPLDLRRLDLAEGLEVLGGFPGFRIPSRNEESEGPS